MDYLVFNINNLDVIAFIVFATIDKAHSNNKCNLSFIINKL